MKKIKIYLSVLIAVALFQTASAQDIQLNILTLPPGTVEVGDTTYIQVDVQNVDASNITAPRYKVRPLVSTSGVVTIIKATIDTLGTPVSASQWLQLSLSAGPGNSIRLEYQDTIANPDTRTFYVQIVAVAVGTGNFTGTLQWGNGVSPGGPDGPQTVGNIPANDNSTTGIIVTAPPVPPNDECPGAIPVPVNPDNNCTQTVAGTTIGATSSGTMGPCSFSTTQPDVWFSFTATSTQHRITLSEFSASDSSFFLGFYSGVCGSLTFISCGNTVNPATFTGLTVGTTYHFRIKTPTAQNFVVCITTPVPLPVNLTAFTAVKQGNTSLLNWNTASEVNNAGFDIERSADGRNFSKIGVVYSKAENGNSHESLDYTYTDATPLNGTNYYRLRQVDRDGKSVYSHIEQVTFGTISGVRIYPNPAAHTVHVEAPEGSQVSVYNIIGQRVTVPATGSGRLMTLDVSALAAGNYTVQVLDNASGSISTHKLTVVK